MDSMQDYPPFITSVEQRRRWDMAKQLAQQLFGDKGAEAVWGATRAIFNSDVPT